MADGGASTWFDEGMDTGSYATTLIKNIKDKFDKDPKIDLKKLLVQSAKENTIWGSSTCAILKFDYKNPFLLKTITIGNSGYMILRKDEKSGKYEIKT